MATLDTLELEELYFYQKLTSSFPDIYARAQENCSIIVIPQYIQNGSSLTRDIIESHLFIPSPCFVRKHVSYNEKFEIELDNNRILKVFHKKDGAGEKRIKVLSQEDVRNSVQNRSYSILIVEQPIVDISRTRTFASGSLTNALIGRYSNSSEPRFNLATATYQTAFLYLDSLRPIEKAFNRLRQELFQFNESCIILPNFIGNAIEKLRDIRQIFLQESYQLLNRTSEDRDIELASEIYITGNTYTKVWPVVIQHNHEKDEHLNENIFKRYKNSLIQSNEHKVNPNLNGENELRKLDDLKTAFEKAACVHSALDSAIAAKTLLTVDTKNTSVSYHSSMNQTPMAADETLTALIDLICQFVSTKNSDESIHLVAHEYYIENFRFLSLPQDVDYAFTTYRGALGYLSDSSVWY